MKFEYIRKTDKPLMEYGHMLSTGDIVDLPEHFAIKAKARPMDYKQIKEIPAVEAVSEETTERIKRKYTRKVKNGD